MVQIVEDAFEIHEGPEPTGLKEVVEHRHLSWGFADLDGAKAVFDGETPGAEGQVIVGCGRAAYMGQRFGEVASLLENKSHLFLKLAGPVEDRN